jgi:hypothetical protein
LFIIPPLRRFILPAMGCLAALLQGCTTLPDDAPPVRLKYVSNFSGNRAHEGLPEGWQPWTLSRFKKPTEYRLVSENGATVVRARASSSASGLVHPLDLDPGQYRMLQWRWKVDQLIAGADNTRKNAEDSPVRVVISFAGDLEKLPFDERLFFDQVKAFAGQQLPYATLMYIWENRAPRNSIIANPHTSRIKMVVAESGRDKLGVWQTESRDIYADFKRAFGEEPGRITAIAIMTDTDNTGENVHAYYGDMVFKQIPRQRIVFGTD